MFGVLNNITNRTHTKGSKNSTASTIASKPAFRAKRPWKDTQPARAIPSDSPEEKQNSATKRPASTPTPKKPSVGKTPAPRLPLDSVKRHIDFQESELEEEFSLLMTPVQDKSLKRKREECQIKPGKRFKSESKTITKLTLELFDIDEGHSEFYRCFAEAEIIPDEEVQRNVIENLCDDDCPTDEEQVEISVKHLKRELENAILNYNSKH